MADIGLGFGFGRGGLSSGFLSETFLTLGFGSPFASSGFSAVAISLPSSAGFFRCSCARLVDAAHQPIAAVNATLARIAFRRICRLYDRHRRNACIVEPSINKVAKT